jgi:hypothetical protein
LNFFPHIGHYFAFLSPIGASTKVTSFLALPFFSDENANDAILWAIKIKNRPGDFKKLIIGNGLGLACSMYDSYV